MEKLISHGICRLKCAANGDDFFQKVPEELPQEDLTGWYLRNFGNIINSDCAKLAFIKDGYTPQDPESVAKFYQQAAKLTETLIREMIYGTKYIRRGDTVIFMAGGNGSGKSTFCDGIRPYLGSDWVIDATLASLDAARNTMEEVFASGANAIIIHFFKMADSALDVFRLEKSAGNLMVNAK